MSGRICLGVIKGKEKKGWKVLFRAPLKVDTYDAAVTFLRPNSSEANIASPSTTIIVIYS
jgi:hypothetical protein